MPNNQMFSTISPDGIHVAPLRAEILSELVILTPAADDVGWGLTRFHDDLPVGLSYHLPGGVSLMLFMEFGVKLLFIDLFLELFRFFLKLLSFFPRACRIYLRAIQHTPF